MIRLALRLSFEGSSSRNMEFIGLHSSSLNTSIFSSWGLSTLPLNVVGNVSLVNYHINRREILFLGLSIVSLVRKIAFQGFAWWVHSKGSSYVEKVRPCLLLKGPINRETPKTPSFHKYWLNKCGSNNAYWYKRFWPSNKMRNKN